LYTLLSPVEQLTEKFAMAHQLICVGLTTLDVNARPVEALPDDGLELIEEVSIAPAGTAAGTAYLAATLGVRTAIASQVGSDPVGRTIRHLLEARGVDARLLSTHPSMPTSTTVILVRPSGDRSRLHALGASRAMTIGKDLESAARSAQYLHYAGIGATQLDGGPGSELLALARASGATITCDLISPRENAAQELASILPHVDYFMPNASEALALSGAASLEQAAERFVAMGARACILKDGANGSLLVSESVVQRIPAHLIVPKDTTGCGDSYCAGFIAARLRGESVVGACRFATAVAALVAQGVGTLGKLESYEQATTFMRATPLQGGAVPT
jgi:sugar/nucleoside kinase (ribokinase family)